MNLKEDIKSRGYWRVVIRPVSFNGQRVQDLSALFPMVQGASVQLRGWDFPHVSRKDDPVVGLNWVSQDTRWEHNLEAWRIYQSGQFAHIAAFWDDWRDHSKWWAPEEGWKPSQRLGIGDTLFRFTEIFEFAARLSSTEAGDDAMHISVTLFNLRDRFLYVDLTLPPETEPARTLEFGRWDRRQDATEAVQHGTDCHEAAAG